MSISGLPPSGGANRIANAYGVNPRRTPAASTHPAAPAGSESAGKAEAAGKTGADQAFKLRSVLNDEERAYFDQISAMGPITYGPGSKGTGMVPEAPRGLRLDVRG